MTYYDNGPFLKSLENSGSNSNPTAMIMGLVFGLVIVSGIAIAQANQLKTVKAHFFALHKTTEAIKAENQKLLAARAAAPQAPVPG